MLLTQMFSQRFTRQRLFLITHSSHFLAKGTSCLAFTCPKLKPEELTISTGKISKYMFEQTGTLWWNWKKSSAHSVLVYISGTFFCCLWFVMSTHEFFNTLSKLSFFRSFWVSNNMVMGKPWKLYKILQRSPKKRLFGGHIFPADQSSNPIIMDHVRVTKEPSQI